MERRHGVESAQEPAHNSRQGKAADKVRLPLTVLRFSSAGEKGARHGV
jgi:hypothetical protein